MKYDRLIKFRQQAYQRLGKAKDATFELMDALLTTRKADCLAEFSLSPFFRRKWPSTYEALEDTRPNANQLMKLYLRQIPKQEPVLLAIDHTVWGRAEAKTLKDRTYQHQSKSYRQRIVGQGYSTIAWIPEGKGSWALPLRNERITSFETPISKGVWQLRQVCRNLNQKVLVVLDSGYGNGSWVKQTADIGVSKLMRIRSNCCLYAKPPAYSGRGAPKKHGEKFKVNDPKTWSRVNQSVEIDDPKLGRLRINQWQELHFRSAASEHLSLIQVERLKPSKSGQQYRPLWLVWVGEQFLPLEQIWSQYACRFYLEHWYRLAKQRLHWTLPNLSTPEQSQRWSHLMPLMTWQLWVAQDLVEQHCLPWQSQQSNLTPQRVAQSMFSLLVEIGTPTCAPKTRGKSPGWPKGHPRTKRTTYPIVKKRYSPPKKGKKKVNSA